MKFVRWNPSRGPVDFRSEMDRLFDGLAGEPAGAGNGGSWVPAADLKEAADGFTIRLDLPGVDRTDVKVSVHDDVVSIRGERKAEKSEVNHSWHRTERVHGIFERSFRLGTPLDPARVKASYQDGVLSVSVPKAESAKPREIEIELGS